MKFWSVIYLSMLVLFSTVLSYGQTGERLDEDLPDPILTSKRWKELPPGQVYQGYLKLNTLWVNNWPLSWQLKGDHLKLNKLYAGWVRKNYFSNPAKSRIHDPQGYLTSIQKQVLTDLLKNHEQVSQLPINLFIFGSRQELITMDVGTAGEEFLNKPNTTLMYYFMGQPMASTGYVKTNKKPDSGDIEDSKPLLDPFLVETMFTKAGTYAATLNQVEPETLYTTVAEVSRRIYWIEQELGLITPSDHGLLESSNDDKSNEDELSTIDKVWEHFGGSKFNMFFIGSGILVALFFLVLAVAIVIYRQLKTYKFPSYSGPIRMAAKYGAGVSEVIVFKDARVSLNDQKKRIADNEG